MSVKLQAFKAVARRAVAAPPSVHESRYVGHHNQARLGIKGPGEPSSEVCSRPSPTSMSDALEEKDAQLKDYGLTRVTEGEHLEAWTTFWGVEIMLQEQVVWKQWVDGASNYTMSTL